MSINITGNGRIDDATAEIAIALRRAKPGSPDQAYYDEAMRLRDAIMAGTRQLALSGAAATLPCPECGGGYTQDYQSGPQYIPHAGECSLGSPDARPTADPARPRGRRAARRISVNPGRASRAPAVPPRGPAAHGEQGLEAGQ